MKIVCLFGACALLATTALPALASDSRDACIQIVEMDGPPEGTGACDCLEAEIADDSKLADELIALSTLPREERESTEGLYNAVVACFPSYARK